MVFKKLAAYEKEQPFPVKSTRTIENQYNQSRKVTITNQ